MPKPPGILDKVNYVITRWEDPCEAPWTVYLETMWPAALKMVVTLLISDLDEAIRGYARPARAMRSRRFGRKMRRGGRLTFLRRIGGILSFDYFNEFGKRFANAKDVRARHVSNGVKNLWIVDGVLQRVLWWWLVIDAVSEFAFQWTSLLYQSEKCREANAGVGLSENPVELTLWSGHTPSAVNVSQVLKERNGPSMLHTGCQVPEGLWNIAFAVQWRPDEDWPDSTLEPYLIIEESGHPKRELRDDRSRQQNGHNEHVISGTTRGPASISTVAQVSQGFIIVPQADLYVHGRSKEFL